MDAKPNHLNFDCYQHQQVQRDKLHRRGALLDAISQQDSIPFPEIRSGWLFRIIPALEEGSPTSEGSSMPYQTESKSSEVLCKTQALSENSFYDLAEVLVCDPVASNRAATRSALYSLGCRHIEITGNLRDFLEALETRPPDLALCEVQVGELELCQAIRELRHGEKSYNPFIIIILTAWMLNTTLATEIMQSGADGLLLRPFSAAMLDQRIRTHVLQQKPFIVTDDYIGPERRAAGRPSSVRSFTSPNSLRTKIEGRAGPDEALRRFNADLRAACANLVDAKQRRNVTPLHP